MKTKIATALSMVGVLGAGSAAALVNTQILDSGPDAGASAAVLPPATAVDVSIPETMVDPSSTVVTTTSTPDPTTSTAVTTAPTTAPAPAATGFLTAFNVGEAGVVTVDVIDGKIVLVDAQPKDGWTVRRADEDHEENQVEVVFVSSTVRVKFEASFVDGKIVPEVHSSALGGATETTAPGTPTTSPTTPPAPVSTVHDQDDDDDDDGVDDGVDDADDHEDEADDRDDDGAGHEDDGRDDGGEHDDD